MDFNDTREFSYRFRPYEFGWMVFHLENGQEVADMFYSNQKSASEHARCNNLMESKSVSDARARLDASKKNIKSETLQNGYYGVMGRYYGD